MVIEPDDERPGTRNDLSGQVGGSVVQAGVIQQLTFMTQETSAAGIPRQLPPAPRGFVNRVRELGELDRLLERAGDDSAPLVAVVNGLGGVGKSALSRHWAYRVRERFADGQLYAHLGDLRHEGGGAAVSDVLGGFLRALGVQEKWIPADLAERAALFRSRTADLQLLILLDDVEHAAQVTPVLPTSSAGVVVVTSHRRLGELVVTGAVPVPLAPLDEDEGVRLLAGVLGQERVHAEPEAARELARLCGGLPVALRVAAARLVQRRGRSIGGLVEELADERRRLERLTAGGRTVVEAVFETAYHALTPEVGRLYRLLGAVPVADFSAQAVQVVAGVGERETERLLDLLLEANLVEETAPDRYRFHDLVRLHAARVAEQEAPEEREAALGRMARWYRACAMAADRAATKERLRLAPVPEPVEPEVTFASEKAALDWLEGERGNMLAVLRVAGLAGWDDVVWQTVEALWPLHHGRKHYADWIEAGRLGTLSARRDGNSAAEARMRNQTARAFVELGDLGPADEELRLARALAEESGDRRLEATVLESLGQVELARKDFDAAIARFTEALALNEALGRTRGTGLQSYHLGLTYTAAGRPQEAFEAFGRARRLMEEAGTENDRAKIDIELGFVHRLLGRPGEIVERVAEATRTMRAKGVPVKEARAWEILAGLTADLGDEPGAHECLRQAIAVHLRLGNTARAEELGERLPS
ncbi:tetratricopeptide repeat protein [Streptosporangium saharense]|uniref:tetratricopeptide repeat protein n=1 Tax=Streptosporangium saharense TaxID=1706840 RepID=UPI003436818E